MVLTALVALCSRDSSCGEFFVRTLSADALTINGDSSMNPLKSPVGVPWYGSRDHDWKGSIFELFFSALG